MMLLGFVVMIASLAMKYSSIPAKVRKNASPERLVKLETRMVKVQNNYIWAMLSGLAIIFISTLV